ncbi:hypothetical protein ETB97_007184 [Aspergillus alliaceus]|uniref:Uncharacterized protein n=1 Tax=Petromyces alliaceus TaxID=209559 RepID=A0A8H6A9X3_PETAA|nr:hypothetical protein ETB97_007184 [Aspergillus burnettii]
MTIDPARLGAEQGLYATIRPEKILDQCIIDYGKCRAIVVFFREASSGALITDISLSLLDVVYQRLFNENIERALGSRPLHLHTPFKTFAETYYGLRKGPKAEATVRFHIEYLRYLRQHYHTLWPRATHHLPVTPERQNENGHVTTFVVPSLVIDIPV